MSGLFHALASAAVAKAETINSYAVTITQLTQSIAELTATNKMLAKQLAAALAKGPATYMAPPPGIPDNTPAPAPAA